MATILQKSGNCFQIKTSIKPIDQVTVYKEIYQTSSNIMDKTNLFVIHGK
jgi:hypothetical protein